VPLRTSSPLRAPAPISVRSSPTAGKTPAKRTAAIPRAGRDRGRSDARHRGELPAGRWPDLSSA
jgi:hypothetical protein